MDITKQEAQDALDEISRVSTRTQRALAHGPSPEILMLWGVVWAVAYVATHFFPDKVGLIWSILGSIGAVGTFVLKSRFAKRITKTDGTAADPNLSKIGWAWVVLAVYSVVWMIILNPAGGDRGFAEGTRQVSAFLASVAMFAYVLGGLWLGRFYIWLGLAVTVFTVVGLFCFPNYFWIWMAVFGGGALLLSGIYMKRPWSPA